jgi:hypothetical protein
MQRASPSRANVRAVRISPLHVEESTGASCRNKGSVLCSLERLVFRDSCEVGETGPYFSVFHIFFGTFSESNVVTCFSHESDRSLFGHYECFR